MQTRRVVDVSQTGILSDEEADIIIVVATAEILQVGLIVVVLARVQFRIHGRPEDEGMAGAVFLADVAPGVVHVAGLEAPRHCREVRCAA